MISNVSFMLKRKKNPQTMEALLSYCYHLQVTLQKDPLHDCRASNSHYRITGSFSYLVINYFLERTYVPKAQRLRGKHFLDMWERRHLHIMHSHVHTQGKWHLRDNSDLNLWGIHKLCIYYMNYIAYSLQSDPARPKACWQQWHQSSVLSLKTWPMGTSSLFRGNLGLQIYAFCTFGG